MSNREWTKSSYSGTGGNCVEFAVDGADVLLRDSKHPEGGVLRFTRAEIDAFLHGAKDGEFDRFG